MFSLTDSCKVYVYDSLLWAPSVASRSYESAPQFVSLFLDPHPYNSVANYSLIVQYSFERPSAEWPLGMKEENLQWEVIQWTEIMGLDEIKQEGELVITAKSAPNSGCFLLVLRGVHRLNWFEGARAIQIIVFLRDNLKSEGKSKDSFYVLLCMIS